ncbi:trypsin-like [Scleropages formosus]|uniref:Trypsin-like n=1 Tax=Scleropages formosus TaxID=113540 RepID=A0A8C9UXQ3_SCLFO|nr:trypsin-like [Scleropages formosus]
MKILLLFFFFSFLTGAVPRYIYKRILGGHDCIPNQTSYHISICDNPCTSGDHVKCGGTLIREKWVLTAASCDGPNIQVIRSSQNLGRIESQRIAQRIRLNFGGQNGDHDIMLLKMEGKIDGRTPVREPNDGECKNLLAGKVHDFDVAGFGIRGYTDGDRPVSTKSLLCVNIEKTDCNQEWKIDNGRFCAGGKGKGTRTGDLGGGLIKNGVVYGVTERGHIPDEKNKAGIIPGVYINVCHFHAGINQHAAVINAA